ncbi:DUF7017 domain-containing protein [Brunnivagina elsteri]|uniref:TOTE conflict systems S1/CSD-like domain-containing protein n=1 Tax=Brunnivagina elsteri CCALA 953 TaxID=987040 RepID=A0A2A2TBJ9_9CYAN|nr:hypothetical protein [Calothrix elsteri]PAX51093.1 hypothetical protein CK510_26720 [Calothrix elsteri CCALA 953]
MPKFIKWASVDSFRAEDLETYLGKDDKVFESLVEKTAREVGKIAIELTAKDYHDAKELQNFAILLIDYALEKAKVQKSEWLNYRKALLLNQLGELEKSQQLLISFVKQKRDDFWAWEALAKVLETSDPALALALYAKACLTCSNPNFGVSVFENLSRLAVHQGKEQLAKWSAKEAFTIRNRNQWKIPQSLRNLLNTSWYTHAENLSNPEEVLESIASDAERVIWSTCPRYYANYLGTFTSKNDKKMVKFGLVSHGESEELVSPVRGLLKNLHLTLGDPVIVTVDRSNERSTIVVIEKRFSGKAFDNILHKCGQFCLKQGGFGFVDDVYVPRELAGQLEDRQMVNLAVMKKFDKKKNQWGLTAIAILDEQRKSLQIHQKNNKIDLLVIKPLQINITNDTQNG